MSDVGRDFLGLAAISAESGALRWVAQPDWDIDDFALSPDGRRVVYQVNIDGYSDARVHDLVTGAESVIPIPPGQAYEPYKWFPTFSWSPDSKQVAFTFAAANRPASIYVAPADGGAAPRRKGCQAVDWTPLSPRLMRSSAIRGSSVRPFRQ